MDDERSPGTGDGGDRRRRSLDSTGGAGLAVRRDVDERRTTSAGTIDGHSEAADGPEGTSDVPDRSRASPGTVSLVGAGPGDPDLLTVRACRLLRTADVVLHDSLLRDAVLEELPSDVEVVNVGKRGEHRTEQSTINDLLVERARAGDAVVRLKGGDPFVFGRGGEEAQHLAAQDVPFEVVPGVSSVLAAPGVAGIPLTHREHSSRFTVITGHETPEKDGSSLDWNDIAGQIKRGGTLVILMGVRTLEENVRALRKHGVAADTPAAIVQRATWPRQAVLTGTLEDIVERTREADVETPATTVVGEVLNVHDEIEKDLCPFEPA
ncbi:MAG: uroporphyrinogen-III C-methyltransferase [Halobacteriales archaeon]